ncbi:DNA mismatch repair protein MutL [Sedimentisphaera cyanobacteriorum]|uniref:DNA mismatch repair protein MutL n=1 Tax=Sedimentisphaera cyanobacteriorum TaxID=1940790 RepID=A0A1Q2HNW6_9BACT|nr:DNA mismatch repair endonuclease MutL [Sedimentisphaera cyanobacteriorum]AQQ09021.1 DNA mismatch repair protein MutL [Sedimentisphaera cyanobacteriorum]
MADNPTNRRIHILDKNMVNMIAAGEVIERPASVAKELLENSIDASADRVYLHIEDGGRKLIQITDNGTGISAEDIPDAFEPHATSKIQKVEDLSSIRSMGFRGEALASIGSIASVKLTSRTKDSIQANSIDIDCGEKGEVFPDSSDYGTKIEVRNIFYKLPARRKFLRTANTEMGHISEQFTRIALANPQLEMKLSHNKRVLHNLSKGQSIEQRIGELISKEIRDNLISIENQERGIMVRAQVCSPSISRGTNKFQYTFLNGRYIRDKFISHAIKEAYRGLLEPGKHPVTFIFLEMPYENYDVNVHPTKTEIRFDNPNLVHSQVLASLREKLLNVKTEVQGSISSAGFDALPSGGERGKSNAGAAFQASETLDEAMNRNSSEYAERIKESMQNFFEKSSPGTTKDLPGFWNQRPSAGSKSHSPRKPFQNAGHSFRPSQNAAEEFSLPPIENRPETEPALNKWFQIHSSYILRETEEGFEIIDQHALHERIIYEKMYARIQDSGKGAPESQKLLIPETFEVREMDREILEASIELLEKLGIHIEPFGPETWAVQSFPTLLRKASPAEFMAEFVERLSDTQIKPGSEELVHCVLDTASCKAAIKAGQKLGDEEIRHLLEEAEQTERSGRCPHGRPTRISFSLKDLEKQFKRTGF